jgi:hypothetical protein
VCLGASPVKTRSSMPRAGERRKSETATPASAWMALPNGRNQDTIPKACVFARYGLHRISHSRLQLARWTAGWERTKRSRFEAAPAKALLTKHVQTSTLDHRGPCATRFEGGPHPQQGNQAPRFRFMSAGGSGWQPVRAKTYRQGPLFNLCSKSLCGLGL